jgi:hypothetical protein
VHAIELRNQAQVGPIVHDEFDVVAQSPFKFTCLIKHHARITALIAVLQQRATGGYELFGKTY